MDSSGSFVSKQLSPSSCSVYSMYFSIMVAIVLAILGMVVHGRGRRPANIRADTIAWRRVNGRLIRKIHLP